MQKKQSEWAWQWKRYSPYVEFLFKDWIFPNTFKDFKGKVALDAGCGQGDYLVGVQPYVAHAVGVDLNTAHLAAGRLKKYKNLSAVSGDIATIQFDKKFDIVYCIGVLQHTDSPQKTFKNLASLVKPGGRLILWVYSYEGNFWNRTVLEWAKKYFFLRLPKPLLVVSGHIFTSLLYVPIYTVYRLPLTFLPFYEYFDNWRKLSYHRNYINVIDKLNAPTTHWIKKSDLKAWFSTKEFKDVFIGPYKGVSWRASGTKR